MSEAYLIATSPIPIGSGVEAYTFTVSGRDFTKTITPVTPNPKVITISSLSGCSGTYSTNPPEYFLKPGGNALAIIPGASFTLRSYTLAGAESPTSGDAACGCKVNTSAEGTITITVIKASFWERVYSGDMQVVFYY